MTALQKAIQRLGSKVALARACGQVPQAVTRWVRTGKVPAHHCRAIEQATKGDVTAQQLRPDVFGAPAKSSRAAA